MISALSLLSFMSAAAPVSPPISAEAQISGAVQAAPEEMRSGATVMGYAEDGRLEVLRQGDNELICLASDPRQESFKAACYHRALEPYMARGRALRAEGVVGKESLERRWAEVEAGELKMPKAPSTLHVLQGSSYDAKSSIVADPFRRWVVYTPFATRQTTGLSDKPNPDGPWLMYAGTAGAHIMITPPRAKK